MTTSSSFVESGLVPYPSEDCESYRSHGWWSGRTLPDELVRAMHAHEDRTGLVTPERSLTYRELLEEATRLAAGLRATFGVRPGEPVMFQMGNVAETVVAYLACLLIGAAPVCTLPQHGAREIGLLAAHVGARVLFTQADFRSDGSAVDLAAQLLAEKRIAEVVLFRGSGAPGLTPAAEVVAAGADAALADLPYADLDPSSVAVYQLSGGTTGLPKVAARLHEEYAYNSLSWTRALGYGPATKLLYPLPLMHNAGISLALQPAMLAGAQLVLAPSADVSGLVALIERYRPDVLPLVPPALAIRLLEEPGISSHDLSSVRDFVVGGQRLPVEIAERLRDELGIKVRQMFGMAEGMFFLTPASASEYVRHNTVGCPISPADRALVVDPLTLDEVPDGQLGELIAAGPYTIRGYFRAAEHNAAAFTDGGFYRTGDLARRHVTDEGVFYSIEGRIKDVINRGVEKIHAEEVEELIFQHPDVTAAALVAMPDPVLGERGCAYLVMESDAEPLTVQTLGAYLRAQGLARYKLPERVEIVARFPLTNVGKVAKKELREDIQAKLESESESGAAR